MNAENGRKEGRRLARGPDMVRWGPVVAGAVIGLAVFVLFDALWLALTADGSGWVGGHLTWFVGVSAAVALLLGGLIAGAYAGVSGPVAGLANGVTTWGFLFVLGVTAIVPSIVNPASGFGASLAQAGRTAGGGDALGAITIGTTMWTVFWSLLAGLVLAAIGGLLGGLLRQSAHPEPAPARHAPPPTPPPATSPATSSSADTVPAGRMVAPPQRVSRDGEDAVDHNAAAGGPDRSSR